MTYTSAGSEKYFYFILFFNWMSKTWQIILKAFPVFLCPYCAFFFVVEAKNLFIVSEKVMHESQK